MIECCLWVFAATSAKSFGELVEQKRQADKDTHSALINYPQTVVKSSWACAPPLSRLHTALFFFLVVPSCFDMKLNPVLPAFLICLAGSDGAKPDPAICGSKMTNSIRMYTDIPTL